MMKDRIVIDDVEYVKASNIDVGKLTEKQVEMALKNLDVEDFIDIVGNVATWKLSTMFCPNADELMYDYDGDTSDFDSEMIKKLLMLNFTTRGMN